MTRPTKKIVAIGGGDSRGAASFRAISAEIIRLTQKKHPRLLFIPTASSDSEVYYSKHVEPYYAKKSGCVTDMLFLIKEHPSRKEIAKKILSADIIYVGGGNTLKMMRIWRRLGVDRLLESAWKRGIVLCGVSAGSICWFESGHSDSLSFYNPKRWKYINVRGLGFLQGVHCPHYNSHTLRVPRKQYFKKMMQKIGGIGIAIDDNCAIEFIDDSYRVIGSTTEDQAFRVFKKNGRVFSERIPKKKELTPTVTLYS